MERPSTPKWIVMGLVLCFVFGACLAVVTPTAEAAAKDPTPPGAFPLLGQGHWQTEWWPWILSILPEDANPLYQKGDVDVSVGQFGRLCFLAGTTVGGPPSPIVRNCTVPLGTMLFFPVLNTLWVNYPEDPEYDPKHPEKWENTVGKILIGLDELCRDYGLFAACEVDGEPVQMHRTLSHVFHAPQPNIFGIPPEETGYGPCMDIGYYVTVPHLSSGQHVIHFSSYNPLFDFPLDVTYNVTVE